MRTTTRPLAERIADATAGSPDVASVARAVFVTVARDVPFAFACLATTDPTSGLITRAYKSAPLPLGDEEFTAAEYGEPDLNQLVDIADRDVPVGVLSVDTDGHPERCRRLSAYMTPQFGFVDEIRLVCRSGGTTWAALGLYRRQGEPFFTAAEGAVVGAVHEVVAAATRNALFTDADAGAQGSRIPVVLVVDDTDRVTGMSAAAEELVDDLGGWDRGSLPAGVLAVAASARARDSLTTARVRARSGSWVVVQGLPLAGTAGQRSVVLTVERASAAVVGALTIAARGLTQREQDVVGLVLKGASTKAIAAALHLSPHTVQDHLKAVFAKLGVSSRRDLVARFAVA
ncbi:helix-turn-helix transcriptional regulator [Microlunatus flavus]|uniref:DNA-binding transcriptional regulator, CsgD family n=1 Tax=Microlunatus flavus TaxID=1036181 RepID=A0A1H9IXH3_9ACTN|nr:helix-turn-helix transcriptional regulator [Microlunatus flavus]SEQ79280.1 DNA-binding transcriptional regulator, CsgD family [Microlunatus flavus]